MAIWSPAPASHRMGGFGHFWSGVHDLRPFFIGPEVNPRGMMRASVKHRGAQNLGGALRFDVPRLAYGAGVTRPRPCGDRCPASVGWQRALRADPIRTFAFYVVLLRGHMIRS